MLFSIILPTFNRGHLLARAIQSVLDQTYTNFELIIIDDGGDDDTQEVADSFADDRIAYHWKENEERSIARNYGINKANGDYINFLDSDDWQYPNHLQVAHEIISSKRSPDMVHLGFEFQDNNGNKLLIQNDWEKEPEKVLIRENVYHGNAIFIRNDIIQKYKFLDSPYAIIGEDWYLWLTLTSRFKIEFDHRITTCVVEHDQRRLRKIDPRKLEQCINLIVETLKKDQAFVNYYGRSRFVFFARQYTFLSLHFGVARVSFRRAGQYLFKGLKNDFYLLFSKRFWASFKHMLLVCLKIS